MKVFKKIDGYTLIELITAIAIIGLIASIAVYTISDTRSKARISKGMSFSQSVNNALGAYAVGIWGFDESSGNIVLDNSGNNHQGVIAGGSSRSDNTPSGEGKSLFFNGVNNVVAVGKGSDYFPMSQFTICAWVKSPGLAAGMNKNGIISLTYGLLLELNASGEFQTAIDNGTSIVAVSAPGNLHDNQFHHLCLTYDGSKRHMFVDGLLKLSQNSVWSGSTRWPTNSCNIGRNNNDAYYYFNGLIDDVRVYSESLSRANIGKIFAQGAEKYQKAL